MSVHSLGWSSHLLFRSDSSKSNVKRGVKKKKNHQYIMCVSVNHICQCPFYNPHKTVRTLRRRRRNRSSDVSEIWNFCPSGPFKIGPDNDDVEKGPFLARLTPTRPMSSVYSEETSIFRGASFLFLDLDDDDEEPFFWRLLLLLLLLLRSFFFGCLCFFSFLCFRGGCNVEVMTVYSILWCYCIVLRFVD